VSTRRAGSAVSAVPATIDAKADNDEESEMSKQSKFAAVALLALSLAACGKPGDKAVSAPAAAKPVDTPAAPAPTAAPAATPAASAPTPAPTGALYQIVDGKVDATTLAGWKAWRSAACERCHGPSQEGLVGPSLIESLKSLSRDEVRATVLTGRVEKGMPSHPFLADKIDGLYAYLKGRSDGAIPAGRLTGIE
jgi:hypothetical protein